MSKNRHGWKVGNEYYVSKQAAYVQRMVDELREEQKDKPKRPATTDQAPSTMRLLSMTDEELEVYRNRPLPENWLANPDAKTNDESVGMRAFDPAEVSHVESLRRKQKNQTGDAWSDGGSVVSPSVKHLAQDAFTFHPSAELTPHQLERVMEPKPIVNTPIPREEEKPVKKRFLGLVWDKAIWGWRSK